MYRLRLETEVCPDGVEGFLHESMKGLRDAIRYRSDRREPPPFREFANLENPVVIRFINATDQTKLFDFLKTWGLPSPRPERYHPHRDIPPNMEIRADILAKQRRLRHLLESAASGDLTKMTVSNLTFMVRSKGILSADNLLSFMEMEIAMVGLNGTRIGRCEYCGDVFLTGKLTANRSTAKYCRDKHRVYGNRAKAKNKKASVSLNTEAK
jgi:hypothetical protein